MRTKTRLRVDILATAFLSVLGITAALLIGRSWAIIVVAVGLLAAYVVSQKILWGRPRKNRKGPRIRRWYALGEIEIPGVLLFSDHHEFDDNVKELQVPRGVYNIDVERFSKGESHCVAAVRFTGETKVDSLLPQEVRLGVDLGFMIFLTCQPGNEVVKVAEDAQERILSETKRELNAEKLFIDGRCLGLITSTGLGDGLYYVRCISTADSRPQIECRYIDDLEEIMYRDRERRDSHPFSLSSGECRS